MNAQIASPCLSFDSPDSSFRDILQAILMIEQFTVDMDFAAFHRDPKTIAAVERKLQIISEAAIRLGEEAEARCPGLPWRDIRGIGNQLRHGYDRIDLEQVWRTLASDLPPLKAAAQKALNRWTAKPIRPPD